MGIRQHLHPCAPFPHRLRRFRAEAQLRFALAATAVTAACGTETSGRESEVLSIVDLPRVDGGSAGRDAAPAPLPRYGGVNLAGAEFAPTKVPGTVAIDYTFPTASHIDYFLGKQARIFRLPILWRRVQPTEKGPLDGAYLAAIDAVVAHTTGKGALVVLDVHDYGRYGGKTLGDQVPNATFADLWGKLGAHFRGNSSVIFGLMNEPHEQDVTAWLGAANAGIAAIRGAGAKNLITVPGLHWTSADFWERSGSTALGNVVDPGDNYVFEVHQYLDSDGSGTHDTCVSATIGSERLTAFTAWARSKKKRAFLGEFAGGRNDLCAQALADILRYLEANPDVWFGSTYWAGGAWWPANYPFSVAPTDGSDRPQMAFLAAHWAKLPR